MTKTPYTPGPWRIAETTKVLLDNARLIRPVDDRNYEYGAVAAIAIGTSQQDAHLIVAAPELLEALEGLLGDTGDLRDDMTCAFCGRDYSGDEDKDPCGECESDDCPANIARAAIAKAKGVAHA